MMTSQFIAMHSNEYFVVLMCSVLEVSGSGNYAWRKREPSRHSREDVFLTFLAFSSRPGASLVNLAPRMIRLEGLPLAWETC